MLVSKPQAILSEIHLCQAEIGLLKVLTPAPRHLRLKISHVLLELRALRRVEALAPFGGMEIAAGPLILAIGAVAAVIGVVSALQANYNEELKKQDDALKSLFVRQ